MSSQNRKDDHIRINLAEDVESERVHNGFERYRIRHCPLPEGNLECVDTGTRFLGRRLTLPLLISSMTGGTDTASRVNRNLAEAAQHRRVAMGVGSQRIMVEERQAARNWRALRRAAPDVPLLANLGLVQLNKGFGLAECMQVVEAIEAEALILHLNVLQECVQPEGDTDWTGLLAKLEQVCRELPVPVIVKEVGWGIDGRTAQRLLAAGVAGIDVAGAGGTSWSEVEMHRAGTRRQQRIAAAFRHWGTPTAVCLQEVGAVVGDRSAGLDRPLVIASGGVRSPLDILKSLALGADLAGVAGPLLRKAVESAEAVVEELEIWGSVLRIAMFCSGCFTVSDVDRRIVVPAEPPLNG
ncbi:MAG: type 2 isopentenyl-diphosphate Delta-isomerase [Caldilineaceae bacterium]|nr:type 2 isopentenyl-diphosphate Delta-isomerase [Caldilineaceae bacterium]